MTAKDLPEVHAILWKEFENHPSPVADFMKVQEGDPFKILVATILSARTKDTTTTVVVRDQLFPRVSRASDLRDLTVEEIEKLIFPVGFYRQKARQLKKLPEVLEQLFDGKIPDNIDDLCKLPGVGRKTANLVVAQAFRKPAICVDVHVHRICNRFGLLKTRNPHETEMELRRILPEEMWIDWNSSLVAFGQRLCTPQSPDCSICPVYRWCARVGVTAKK